MATKYIHVASSEVVEATRFAETCLWHPTNGNTQPAMWQDKQRGDYERVERGDMLVEHRPFPYSATTTKFIVPRLIFGFLYVPYVEPPAAGNAEPAF